jgi:hypothetical protein
MTTKAYTPFFSPVLLLVVFLAFVATIGLLCFALNTAWANERALVTQANELRAGQNQNPETKP